MLAQTIFSHLCRFSAFKVFVLCLLAGFCSMAFAEDWDGSTSKPSSKKIDGVEYYVITSPEEMAWFAYQVNINEKNNINAVLGNDIYFMEDSTKVSSVQWSAIGNINSTAYNGIFDGAGHAIFGIYSQSTIFGYTGENFVLKNFSIKNGDIVTWVNVNNGIIENCIEKNNKAKQVAGFAQKNMER
jgi:hypothetical protein